MGIFIVALTLGSVLPILIQKLFIRFNKFDDINHRSSHNAIATRTGGIGLFLSLFGITIYQYALGEEIYDFSILIPLSIMFIIGVYDDLYNADFKLKFLLQIIVAKILIDQGFVITDFYGLFGLNKVPWLIAQISTVFVFLVVVNAINFIDGIDALAITEVIKTIIIIEFASKSNTPLFNLGIVIIATILPLYYFNLRKKNKVFLGDAGSLFLGSLLMVYLLYMLGPNYQFKNGYQLNKTLFSIIVIVFPLLDLLRIFILRIKKGVSPFSPDKNHIHHYINKLFNSQWISTLFIQTISLIFISIVMFALKK